MKDLPILMSTAMVQATLDDLKTETRRLTGLQEINEAPEQWAFAGMWQHTDIKEEKLKPGYYACFESVYPSMEASIFVRTPYGQSGDQLYVRETWKPVGWGLDGDDWVVGYKNGDRYNAGHLFDDPDKQLEFWEKISTLLDAKGYKTNEDGCFKLKVTDIPFRPSIHMPKAASRIWLDNASVHCERLHDISQESIKAEGVRILVHPKSKKPLFILGEPNKVIHFLPDGWGSIDTPKVKQEELMFAHWAELWCNINGRESWDSNPFVWVLKFKVISTTGKP